MPRPERELPVHYPERICNEHATTDIFTIETFRHQVCLHGPILMPISKALLPELVKLPRPQLESSARWNAVRLGRASTQQFPSGFEGYVMADNDPAQKLSDISLTHIASVFEGYSGCLHPEKTIARKEKSILAFIEKLRQNQSLSAGEIQIGHNLMGIIVARLRANESMQQNDPTKKRKLSEFRRVTERHAQQITPKVAVHGDENATHSIHWMWNRNPETIAADISLPTAHLKELDLLILELLSELGRFGNPLVRKWIQLHSQTQGLR